MCTLILCPLHLIIIIILKGLHSIRRIKIKSGFLITEKIFTYSVSGQSTQAKTVKASRSGHRHSSEEQAELQPAAADGGAAGSKDPPGT